MRGRVPNDELCICTTSAHTFPQCSVGGARLSGFVKLMQCSSAGAIAGIQYYLIPRACRRSQGLPGARSA